MLSVLTQPWLIIILPSLHASGSGVRLSMMAPTLSRSFQLTGASCPLLGPLGFSWLVSFAPDFQRCFFFQIFRDSPIAGQHNVSVLLVFRNFVLLIVPSRYFCGGSFCFMSWCIKFFVLLAPYVCFHIFS